MQIQNNQQNNFTNYDFYSTCFILGVGNKLMSLISHTAEKALESCKQEWVSDCILRKSASELACNYHFTMSDVCEKEKILKYVATSLSIYYMAITVVTVVSISYLHIRAQER